MKSAAKVLMLLLAGLVALPAASRGNDEPKEIDPYSFWYNVGLGRAVIVSETPTDFTVQIQSRHGPVLSRVKKDRAADPKAKSEAFKRVVQELLSWLKTDAAAFAISKLQTMTGEPFTHVADWDLWYRDNADYLVWSDRLKRFFVDSEAKQMGVPTDLYRQTHPWVRPP